MSKDENCVTRRGPNGASQWVATFAANPSAPESRGDPLSAEDVDAQIRWFFEHAREENSPRP